MTKSIAFIHARGGSKRIPRKNIKMFHGKPLIAYPIQTALSSGIFDKVIVSTDDQEIADIAIKHGAEVNTLRPAHLSNDTATTDEVFIHDIKKELENGDFDYACCIYGTSVFLDSDYLAKALDVLKSEPELHNVNSITEYDFSIFRALKETNEGVIEFINPEHRLTRSQDLPDAYHDAAQFYFVNVQSYLNNPRVFSDGGTKGIKIPHYKIVDIDTPDDWVRAEMVYQSLHGQPNP